MNVEIGTEAAQFPEKEYINGIFVAVYTHTYTVRHPSRHHSLFQQLTYKELDTDNLGLFLRSLCLYNLILLSLCL
jgi:hypothetical protein